MIQYTQVLFIDRYTCYGSYKLIYAWSVGVIILFVTIATAFIEFPHTNANTSLWYRGKHLTRSMAEPEIVSGSILYGRSEVLTVMNIKIRSLGHLRCDTVKSGIENVLPQFSTPKMRASPSSETLIYISTKLQDIIFQKTANFCNYLYTECRPIWRW
jgi:hypothetical protein